MTHDHRILVVDDEPDITALVAYHLAKAGYRVSTAANGPDALQGRAGGAARRRRPRPHAARASRATTCWRSCGSREETRDVGVILLTARREESRPDPGPLARRRRLPHQAVLPAGADAPGRGAAPPAGLAGGDGRLHAHRRPDHRSTARPTAPASTGGSSSLTATEYKLLLTLVERRGRVQTRPQLLETVWEAQPDIQTRTVDMHVQRLRSKLGEAGKLIETVRGFGYRFRGTERASRAR